MRHLLLLTALTLSSLAAAQTDDATPFTGTWTGTYRCAQGLTDATLRINGAHDGAATATLTFSADPTNPSVPTGSYTLQGTTQPGHVLTLHAGPWLDQPNGYTAVDLILKYTPTEQALYGLIPDDRCSTVTLHR